MAYSINADVINEFKSLDTSGIISKTKIDTWIGQADAYINGRIGLIYVTPVTATNSLLILKEISIGLVAQRVARILQTKSITPQGDQDVPKDLIVMAESRLKMIVDRKLILSDADKVSSSDGVASYTGSNDVKRAFKQGVDQW